MDFNPRNLLVIDFGQLGDVVMSLPALRAIREKFPHARITVAAGTPSSQIVELSGYADELIAVDRVALRDGFIPLSIMRIVNVVKDIRRRQFDFVIDLHSFSETNLLGLLSGASRRLFARRPGRSLDFLANFNPKPPVDRNDPDQHLVDRYLDVLKPLGIAGVPRIPTITPRADDNPGNRPSAEAGESGIRHTARRLISRRRTSGQGLAGRSMGGIADFLIRNDGVRPVVFIGPEERAGVQSMRRQFPAPAIFLEKLSIGELAAAQARLAVFVSNDTGPVHLAAAVGAPIVVLIGRLTPHAYIPLATSKRLIFSEGVHAISVEEVYAATREMLAVERMTTLFAS
jgi:ADP-heptose:LPS heptosyltransferase